MARSALTPTDVGKWDRPACGDDEDNDDNDVRVAEWSDEQAH